jgi:hypothetical protein
MGTVIGFPGQLRGTRPRWRGVNPESATVIILPVIRIERHPEEPAEPTTSRSQRRRRRRRASRSKASA